MNTLHKSRKSNERCERKKGKEEIEKLKSNQVPYFSKSEFQKELAISPFRNLGKALNLSWKPFPGEGIKESRGRDQKRDLMLKRIEENRREEYRHIIKEMQLKGWIISLAQNKAEVK